MTNQKGGNTYLQKPLFNKAISTLTKWPFRASFSS